VTVGTGVETRIRDLAETIHRLSGFEGEIVWDTSMPDGQPTRYLDVSRARDLMGFEAEMPLDEGLRRTIESFRAQQATPAAS
jgi:GDP-L-fucose synthase